MPTEGEHPLEFLPELALGVLPDIDAIPVRRHLEVCGSCRAEHDEMARVAALLPMAAPDIEPSPAVKAAVLDRIAREPRRIDARRERPYRWWAATAAAGVALIVAASAAGWLIGRRQNDVAGLRTEIGRQASLVQAAAKGTMQTSDAREGDAWAAFVRAPGATWGYAWVAGLPPLPAGKVYQAWFSRDGASYEPSALFDIQKGGVWLWADSRLDDYTELELTVEDAHGAPAPTSPAVISIRLDGASQPNSPVQ